MTELAKDVAAIDVTDLLKRYSFDLNGATLDRLVEVWLNRYPIQWVRLAVIEALYQGRYKAFSVEQILNLWQRRGRAIYRFNHEFERVVCGRFPSTHYMPLVSQYAATARPYSRPYPTYRKPLPPSIEPERLQETASSPALFKAKPSIVASEQARPADAAAVSPPFAEPETSGLEPVEPEPTEAAIEPDSEPEAAGEIEKTPLSLSKGIPPVPAFQPSDALELEPLVALSASRSTVHQQPIHQFVPSSESSDFYAKLRAVAQGVAAVEAE